MSPKPHRNSGVNPPSECWAFPLPHTSLSEVSQGEWVKTVYTEAALWQGPQSPANTQSLLILTVEVQNETWPVASEFPVLAKPAEAQ